MSVRTTPESDIRSEIETSDATHAVCFLCARETHSEFETSICGIALDPDEEIALSNVVLKCQACWNPSHCPTCGAVLLYG